MLKIEKEIFNLNELLLKVIYDDKSYISGIVYVNDELYINYFHVDIKNRGKGIGSQLLKKIILISKNEYNIKEVTLTDESERYRKNKNIYIKFGFFYIDSTNTMKLFFNSRNLLQFQ